MKQLSTQQYNWAPLTTIWPKPEPVAIDWLMNQSSLTQRLKQLSHTSFEVKVFEQRWLRGNNIARSFYNHHPNLRHRLNHQRFWSRKVELVVDGNTLVFAHTLIPQSTLTAIRFPLTQLKTRSLGSFLFNHPLIKRGPIEICTQSGIMARRSIFWFHQHPISVSEFFIDPCFQNQK